VAETGSIVLVTNEGNGRLVTSAPPVHIAFIGIERVVPRLADLPPLLQLLPRSATGQSLTSYVSLIQGPRAPGDAGGPLKRHAILVDNGRRRMANSKLRDSLACIRCGACLNVCPVFREIGGHAYGSTYPGPIGSVVSPGLFGLASHGHLAKASSLCGACREVCPADIDLPSMLLRVRDEHVRQMPQPWWWRWGMRAFAHMAGGPRRFGAALGLLGGLVPLLPSRNGWTTWLPGPLGAWTRWRHFPRFQRRPFRARLRELSLAARAVGPTPFSERTTRPLPRTVEDVDLVERFRRELEAVGGEVILTPAPQMPAVLARLLESTGCSQVLLAWTDRKHVEGRDSLEAALRGLTRAKVVPAARARETCASLEQAEVSVGLTPAVAALADSGTIVIESGAHGALEASLLPATHIAVLDTRDLYPTFADWAGRGGRSLLLERSSVALVTGPSRTADIEMTLTIGVHGPRRLIVLVCGAQDGAPARSGR
jgi:L-lactate utilization protein LutB